MQAQIVITRPIIAAGETPAGDITHGHRGFAIDTQAFDVWRGRCLLIFFETVAELPGLSSTCTMKRGKGLLTAFGLSFTPHIERQTRTDLR